MNGKRKTSGIVLLTIFCILIGSTGLSCSTDSPVWTGMYGDEESGTQNIWILEADEDGYLIAGNKYKFMETFENHREAFFRSFLLTLGSEGQEKKLKTVGDYRNTGVTDRIFKTDDETLLFIEHERIEPSESGYQGRYYSVNFTGIDLNGKQQWQTTITTDIRTAFRIDRKSGNTILLSGYTADQSFIRMIEVSTSGIELSKGKINLTPGAPEYSRITCLPNGGYMLTGTVSEGGSTGNANIYISRLDETGIPIWARTIGYPNQSEHLDSVTVTSKGQYLVTGSINPSPEPRTDSNLYAALLDADGGRLWETTWGSDDIGESPIVAAETADGGFIIAGVKMYNLPISDRQAFMLKLNENGNELWSRYLNTERKKTTISDMVLLPDGSIVIAGTTSATGEGQLDIDHILVMKLDPDGNYERFE